MKEMLKNTGIVIKGIVMGMSQSQKGNFSVKLLIDKIDRQVSVGILPETVSKVKEGELFSVLASIGEYQGRTFFKEVPSHK